MVMSLTIHKALRRDNGFRGNAHFGNIQKFRANDSRPCDSRFWRWLLSGIIVSFPGFLTFAYDEQMAMCSIPELMPNKYRHIGICISDGFVFLIVIIGPVVGRYAIDSGNSWKYIYYGGFIAQVISLICLALLYFPPKHPKGVPWREALPHLDYVGTLLVIPGVCLALVGIINTTVRPPDIGKLLDED